MLQPNNFLHHAAEMGRHAGAGSGAGCLGGLFPPPLHAGQSGSSSQGAGRSAQVLVSVSASALSPKSTCPSPSEQQAAVSPSGSKAPLHVPVTSYSPAASHSLLSVEAFARSVRYASDGLCDHQHRCRSRWTLRGLSLRRTDWSRSRTSRRTDHPCSNLHG